MVRAINFAFLVFVVPSIAGAQSYYPIAKGEPSPVDGVVMSEERATAIAQEKIELFELKSQYEIDKRAWRFKEDLYKKGMEQRDERISKLEDTIDSWWSRHKMEVGVVLGVLGAIGVGSGMGALVNR